MRRLLVVRACVVAFAVVLVIPTVALAHAELDEAAPGPGEVITSVPRQLVATFTQSLDPRRSSVELRSSAGERLARGGATRAREMRLELPRLGPGTYTVRWTTFSTEDNELARGTYTFRVVAAAASPTPTAADVSPSPSPDVTRSPTPPEAPTDPGFLDSLAAVLPVFVTLLVVGAIATAFVVRRR